MNDSWIGMPGEAFDDYGDRIAGMYDTSNTPAKTLDAGPAMTACRPGSSGYGPIRELGRFYDMLRARRRTAREVGRTDRSSQSSIVSPQALEAPTARPRPGVCDH